MAKYSRTELMSAANEGRRIGGYQGKNVYACSKWAYASKARNDAYYVLYDEMNHMVINGAIIGTIDQKGQLDVWDKSKTWRAPLETMSSSNWEPVVSKKTPTPASKTQIPATEYSAMVNNGEGPVDPSNFFANLDKEINQLLVTEFEMGDMPWASVS